MLFFDDIIPNYNTSTDDGSPPEKQQRLNTSNDGESGQTTNPETSREDSLLTSSSSSSVLSSQYHHTQRRQRRVQQKYPPYRRHQKNISDILISERAIEYFISLRSGKPLFNITTFWQNVDYRTVGVLVPVQLLEMINIGFTDVKSLVRNLTMVLKAHCEELHRVTIGKNLTMYRPPNFLTVSLARIWQKVPLSDFLSNIVPCFISVCKIRRVQLQNDPTAILVKQDHALHRHDMFNIYYTIQYMAIVRRKLLDNFDLMKPIDFLQIRELFVTAVINEHFGLAILLSCFVDRTTVNEMIDRYMTECEFHDGLLYTNAEALDFVDFVTTVRGESKRSLPECQRVLWLNKRKFCSQIWCQTIYEVFRENTTLFRAATLSFFREYGIVHNSLCVPEDYAIIMKEIFRRVADSYLVIMSDCYAYRKQQSYCSIPSTSDDLSFQFCQSFLKSYKVHEEKVLHYIYNDSAENTHSDLEYFSQLSKFGLVSKLRNFWSSIDLNCLNIGVSVPLRLLTLIKIKQDDQFIVGFLDHVLQAYGSEISKMEKRTIKQQAYSVPQFLHTRMTPLWNAISLDDFILVFIPRMLQLPNYRSLEPSSSHVKDLYERYNTAQFFCIIYDVLTHNSTDLFDRVVGNNVIYMRKLFLRAIRLQYFHLALPLSFFVDRITIKQSIMRMVKHQRTIRSKCYFRRMHTVFDFLYKVHDVQIQPCKCIVSTRRRRVMSQYETVLTDGIFLTKWKTLRIFAILMFDEFRYDDVLCQLRQL